jgi:hypothetical protein
VGESGGSAERRAEMLRATGDADAAAWAAGAEGERRVAEALSALGAPYLVLHDRLLRPGLTESNLDHVVVGPPGVILVDAKNWGGNVTEWNGGLYQHRWDAAGKTSHESKHAEIAKVHAMAREMAERLSGPVTPVLCLAGARAAAFGDPQMVRGVWVVPVQRLAEWVAARPILVAGDALDRLSTLVMTEFPSTTTDPSLLAAIGADLARRTEPRRAARRQRADRKPVLHPPSRQRGSATGTRPPARRRSTVARVILLVAGAAAAWWGLTHGVVGALWDTVGRPASETFVNGVAGVPSDPLSCADFDPGAARALRGVELTAVASPSGCEWYVVDKNGKKASALRLQEFTGATEKLSPTLERSRESRKPEVHDSYALVGETTVLSVAAGVPISRTQNVPLATRSMTVQVSHELLGLSRKQGRQLATTVARTASNHHDLVPTTTATS